jgi:hypothetical protein
MARRLIDLPEMIVRDVAELPDRTSPPDAPEMMLVTAAELDRIVSDRIAELIHEGRDVAFYKWWKLSTHNGTLPQHRENLAREAYYAAWGGSAQTTRLRDE